MEKRSVTLVPEELESGAFANWVTSSATTETITLDFLCPMPNTLHQDDDGSIVQIDPSKLVARLHFTPSNLAVIRELIDAAIDKQRDWAEHGSKEEVDEENTPPTRSSPANHGYI